MAPRPSSTLLACTLFSIYALYTNAFTSISPVVSTTSYYDCSINVNRHQPHHPSSSSSTKKKNHRRSPITSSLSSSQPTNTNEQQEPPLTPTTIAEMIEVSFLNSCLQLSQGYVDVLKLFIVAVQAGHDQQLSLGTLDKLVEDCPVNSAGRDLMVEEKGLRREWMMVVYDMLDALKETTRLTSDDDDDIYNVNEEVANRVSSVVSSILSIQQTLKQEEEQSGGKQDAIAVMSSLSVEEAIAKSTHLSQLFEDATNSPMDKAFLTNDVRVALLTCRVIEEEKLCLEGSSGSVVGDVPRPPIPGTS